MYIVLEGIVGSGKSTQVRKLGEYLQWEWHDVVHVREPGTTPIAEDIRHLAQVKDWEGEHMHPLTNAYLYAAARSQTLHTIVRPALDAGKIVVADRCFLSSCTIQWEAQWLGIDTILDINHEAILGIIPDVVIYLDIDADTALSRIFDHSGDKFEREWKSFYQAIIRWYEKCEKLEIMKNRFVRIDASGTEDEVFARILRKLNSLKHV